MSNFGERTLIREFTAKSNGEVVRVYEHSGVEIESISLRDVKNREAEIREEFVIHLDSLGHMVNFKTRKQSYRSNKKLENPPDQWKIFENTHEAVIDEETFARVIAVRNCTTVPATVLKPDKTTSCALLPLKRARKSATPTSSVPWYWKKVHSNT